MIVGTTAVPIFLCPFELEIFKRYDKFSIMELNGERKRFFCSYKLHLTRESCVLKLHFIQQPKEFVQRTPFYFAQKGGCGNFAIEKVKVE